MSSQLAKTLASCGALLFVSANAHADAYPTGWASARALGMGNAYTSAVDDSDAMFYNPAAMTRIKGFHVLFMDPHVGIDNPSNIQQVKSITNTSDLANEINNYYGQQFSAGGGAKTAVTMSGLGIAGYVNSQASVLASNPPDPHATIDAYFDYGAALSLAADFVPGVLSVGVTGRYINRTGTNSTVGAATLAQGNTTALQNILKSRGDGVALDAGILLTMPGPISPALSLVYRDIGTTSFSHTEGATSPPVSPSELIAGASITMKALLISITPSVDYRYLNWSNVPYGENIDAGVELGLPLIDLRGGLSQGYWTAGAGVDLGLIRADMATWAVELGAYPGQAVDRRYMAQITIEMGLDPWKYFGFGASSGSTGSSSGDGSDTDSSSSRRHLKQRR